MNIRKVHQEYWELKDLKGSNQATVGYLCEEIEYFTASSSSYKVFIVSIVRHMVGCDDHAEATRKAHAKKLQEGNLEPLSLFDMVNIIPVSEEQYHSLGLSLTLIYMTIKNSLRSIDHPNF